MKQRITIRQHVLVPAIVQHEVEFDAELGTCEYIADGSVVSHQETLSIEDLHRATPDKEKDGGADEIACKALLDAGILSPKPGDPIVIHGRKIEYEPEAWDDEELIVPHPRVVPFPEPVQVWRQRNEDVPVRRRERPRPERLREDAGSVLRLLQVARQDVYDKTFNLGRLLDHWNASPLPTERLAARFGRIWLERFAEHVRGRSDVQVLIDIIIDIGDGADQLRPRCSIHDDVWDAFQQAHAETEEVGA